MHRRNPQPHPCPICGDMPTVGRNYGGHWDVWCAECFDMADDAPPYPIAGGRYREDAIESWNELREEEAE